MPNLVQVPPGALFVADWEAALWAGERGRALPRPPEALQAAHWGLGVGPHHRGPLGQDQLQGGDVADGHHVPSRKKQKKIFQIQILFYYTYVGEIERGRELLPGN